MPTEVLLTERILDGITPIAAYAALADHGEGRSFLLESAPGAQQTARFSIIGLGVLAELRAVDGAVEVQGAAGIQRLAGTDVLEAARQMLRALKPKAGTGGAWSRFLGAYGAAAFVFAGYLELLPRLPRGDDPMPDLHLVVPETIVAFDHFTHKTAVLTLGASSERHSAACKALVHATIDQLSAPEDGSGRSPVSTVLASPTRGRLSYVDAVERAKESIRAGDVFQVVLSQRWQLRSQAHPFDAYRMLRAINPSPYMYYLDFGWGQLFGSSPEVLVRLDGTTARLRPLAGTRQRDPDPDAERRIEARLRRDPKERAEHVMLVDLGRNDLGRVCAPGSIRVTDLMSVERFSHVMHLVSEVRGTLGNGRDAFDLFASAFPAGTVSGAPKIRAMELIAELECARRGFYAGSIGYFGFDGSMDACITLRSAHARGAVFEVAAGAGIVADSVATSEDRECHAKAAAVACAIVAVDAALTDDAETRTRVIGEVIAR